MGFIFKKLVPVEEAQKILLDNIYTCKKTEITPIDDALYRVSAENIFSEIDIPCFDRSIMDGYALRYIDIANASETSPIVLDLIGYVKIGTMPDQTVKKGTAIRVDTGSVIPIGADAVVPLEYCHEENKKIIVFRSIEKGANIQWTGGDIMKGELILQEGTIINTRHIGALSASGYTKILVRPKPRVAIFSIGDELVNVGEALEEGKIYDINIHTIASLIKSCGGDPIILGISPDSMEGIMNKLTEGLKMADFVVSTGGSSVGQFDFIRTVVENIGGKILFHGVMSKPGKPVLATKIGDKLYIGLPGNPTSAIISFILYVRPVIYKFLGCRVDYVSDLTIRLAKPEYGFKGRRLYKTVVLRRRGNKLYYESLKPSSESISTLLKADGYFIIPENVEFLQENTLAEVYLFNYPPQITDILVVGEFSPTILYAIIDVANALELKIKYVRKSSSGAIMSIQKQSADIAITTEPLKDSIELQRELVLISRRDDIVRVASVYNVCNQNYEIQKVGTHQSSMFRLIHGFVDGAILPLEIAKIYDIKRFKTQKMGTEKIYVYVCDYINYRDKIIEVIKTLNIPF